MEEQNNNSEPGPASKKYVTKREYYDFSNNIYRYIKISFK